MDTDTGYSHLSVTATCNTTTNRVLTPPTPSLTGIVGEDLALDLVQTGGRRVVLLEHLGQQRVHDSLHVGLVQVEDQLVLLDEQLDIGVASVLRPEVLHGHTLRMREIGQG